MGDLHVRCRMLALIGHGAMSDLSPLSGAKRKLDFGAVRAAKTQFGHLIVCGETFTQASLSRGVGDEVFAHIFDS